MKKRCREEATPIPTIYDEEIGGLRNSECDDSVEDMIRNIPTFQACKSSLYRKRSTTTPKLPTSPEDINLEGPWTCTSAGDRFLLRDDTDENGHRIIIFATDANLNHLCAADTVFSDGTFYSCTKHFTQLYTLHASVNGAVFPLVYGLLPNKSEATYNRFFGLLKDAVQDLQSVLNPEHWLLDFEVAAKNAVQRNFPRTSLKGCFFHYTQCIWRKVQGCGLAVRFREENSVRLLVRRAAVLPLIPEHRVEDVWLEALEDNEDDDHDVLRFKDYVTETWVEGHLTHWNHYDNDGSRTTNVVEGWHHKFNRMCRRPHPNIFMFIQLIQKEQAANEAKMIQLAAGGVVRPKKKKYRQLDTRIRQLKDRLRQGNIQLMEYADAASHLIHLE